MTCVIFYLQVMIVYCANKSHPMTRVFLHDIPNKKPQWGTLGPASGDAIS